MRVFFFSSVEEALRKKGREEKEKKEKKENTKLFLTHPKLSISLLMSSGLLDCSAPLVLGTTQ